MNHPVGDAPFLLEQLVNLKSQIDLLRIEKQRLIDRIIDESGIRPALNAVDAEFDSKLEVATEKQTELEAAVKSVVLEDGKSVSTDHMQAVYASGRVSWDNDALNEYARDHPEILQFRRAGAPYVALKLKG